MHRDKLVHKEPRGLLVAKGHKVSKVLGDPKELRELLEHKEVKEFKALLVLKALRVLKVFKEARAHRVR